jgi:zinc/manganese transport system permease protein
VNADAFALTILGPAIIAGLLVLATHVPLGLHVLRRGIVFIDLAIAQVAGFGVIAADRFGWEPSSWLGQCAALVAALAAALLLTWTERRWPNIQEALIGTMFALAATGTTLVLAGHPHGGEHLKDLLVGQILWVSRDQIVSMAIVTGIVLAVWFASQKSFGRIAFYLAFALSVTASVQLVGIYLVFASLIVPALGVHTMKRAAMISAYLIGVVGYLVGLSASAVFDWPSGPVVVWTLAVCALGFSIGRWVRTRFTPHPY